MKIREAFCAIEQLDTDHEVTIDPNGDYLFTCPCGSFLKFPGEFKKKDIDAALIANKQANEGQVTTEQIAKANEAKLENV